MKYLHQICFSAYFPNLAHPLTSRIYFVTFVYLVNSFAYLVIVVKDEGRPRQGHVSPERELRFRSTLSLTTSLDWAIVERHALSALPSARRNRTHFTGLGVGPKAVLYRCGLSGPYAYFQIIHAFGNGGRSYVRNQSRSVQ